MGNCCGEPRRGDRSPIHVTGGTSGGHYAGSRADRNVLAEAAERRLQEQASRGVKGEVRLPKSRDELPDLPSDREAGLRWQVG